MPNFIYVMLGGAFGAAGRYGIGVLMGRLLPGYPWGTLVANLLGGFLMGALIGILARMSGGQETLRLLLAIGFLGGFTTFSSFALDSVTMIDRGAWGAMMLYVAVSVTGSILAVIAGMAVTRLSA
ncbi:fluoride efflux transporter CrcB [Stakelama sediminis]|uniref:Fluoride-specific ion channel FluC n=1 Tax=Stakelama sediminis TaxID=463200 RepID=A0A840Z0M6_9SPHN|nr:CrcB family protein [Stakelama sediminis]MBB5719453.1 CrcB protein [Stakelama sediminis]